MRSLFEFEWRTRAGCARVFSFFIGGTRPIAELFSSIKKIGEFFIAPTYVCVFEGGVVVTHFGRWFESIMYLQYDKMIIYDKIFNVYIVKNCFFMYLVCF